MIILLLALQIIGNVNGQVTLKKSVTRKKLIQIKTEIGYENYEKAMSVFYYVFWFIRTPIPELSGHFLGLQFLQK